MAFRKSKHIHQENKWLNAATAGCGKSAKKL